MKVYVISDSPSYGIAASNIINAAGEAGMLSELGDADLKAMLEDVRENANSGYDVVLVLWEGAKAASISANKMSGIRAVVCKDKDDAIEAMSEDRANVVFIDSAKLDRRTLSSITNGILVPPAEPEGGGKERPAPKAAPQQARKEFAQPAGRPLLAGLKDAARNMKARAAERIAERAEQKPARSSGADEGEGMMRSIRKKGLKKTLKETFGLDEG